MVLAKRQNSIVEDVVVPDPIRIRRPKHSRRVLCRYDERFPPPDQEFLEAMSESRVMVPLPRIGRKATEESIWAYAREHNWAKRPEELVFAPMHDPLHTAENTIQGRSLNTEVPLTRVRDGREYTFKGSGFRDNPLWRAFGYAFFEDIAERRWRGFARAGTTKHAVNVTSEIRREFDDAKSGADPIVLAAAKAGYNEANTLRYGCVLKPLQTVVRIARPEDDLEKYAEYLLPDEVEAIQMRGAGLYPLHRGFEIDMMLDSADKFNQLVVKRLMDCETGGESGRMALHLLTNPDVTSALIYHHGYEVQEDNRKTVVSDIINNKRLSPGEAAGEIKKRNDRMLAERDEIKGERVFFGYSVPLQVRLYDLAQGKGPIRYDSEECREYLGQWKKTFKWFGFDLEVDRGYRMRVTDERGKRVKLIDACEQILDKFTTGCTLAYHLVVNRMNGTFGIQGVGSALDPLNFLAIGYLVDNDTINLRQPGDDDRCDRVQEAEFKGLIRLMHSSLKSLMGGYEQRHILGHAWNTLWGESSEWMGNPAKFMAKFEKEIIRGRKYVDDDRRLSYRRHYTEEIPVI